MINEELKTFYNPGDIVRIRHNELDYKPIMYVVEKVTRTLASKDTGSYETAFIGIKCR